ncbi:hypothetical protein GCM10009818_30320 [Nakamurella flavida]
MQSFHQRGRPPVAAPARPTAPMPTHPLPAAHPQGTSAVRMREKKTGNAEHISPGTTPADLVTRIVEIMFPGRSAARADIRRADVGARADRARNGSSAEQIRL